MELSPRVETWIGRAVPAAIAGYFLLQFLLRVAFSTGLELDEAEQMVLTQRWQLLYGPQPPLYTWLQKLVFAVTGPGIVGLAFLKNLLLAGTYLAVFAVARRWSGSALAAGLAVFLLLWIPQLAWESQRDLTHTVLVTAIAAGTLWSFARLREWPTVGGYLLLGVFFAAGFLSKYNYALFWAGLLLASLATPAVRRILLRKSFLLTLGVLFLLVLPYALGGLFAWERITGSLHKLEPAAGGYTFPGDAWAGVRALAWALFLYAGLLLLPALYLGILRRWGRSGEPLPLAERGWPGAAEFLGRLVLASVAVAVLFVLLSGSTHFKDRWFQPLLFFLPLWIVVGLYRRVPPLPVLRRFALASGVLAATVLATMTARVVGWTPSRHHQPFAEAAAEIRAEYGAPAVWYAEDGYLAGNFRRFFPESFFVAPEGPLPRGGAEGAGPTGAFLLLWADEEEAAPPPTLRRLAGLREGASRLPEGQLLAPAGADGSEEDGSGPFPVRVLRISGEPRSSAASP
jgi:4-amino-4-deoxy-L-arabinose transferase-like glycosyltransferase